MILTTCAIGAHRFRGGGMFCGGVFFFGFAKRLLGFIGGFAS